MELSSRVSKKIKDKFEFLRTCDYKVHDDFIELINKAYEEGKADGYDEGLKNANVVSKKMRTWSNRN